MALRDRAILTATSVGVLAALGFGALCFAFYQSDFFVVKAVVFGSRFGPHNARYGERSGCFGVEWEHEDYDGRRRCVGVPWGRFRCTNSPAFGETPVPCPADFPSGD